MRTRLAVVAMLVFGGLFTGGGSALALWGSGSDASTAGEVVYPQDLLGEETPGGEGEGAPDLLGDAPADGAPAGETATAPVVDLQEPRQTEVRSIPFTGLAVLPVIAIGAAMLLVGGLTARKLKED